MSDEKLTKLTGSVLAAVSAQVRHLIDTDLVDPEEMRLTVEARAVKAKALVDGGLSQRKAAVVLGVDESTVRADLRGNPAKSAGQSRTSDRDERHEAAILKNEALAEVAILTPETTYETIIVDPPWPMTKIERDVRPNQVAFDYPTMTDDQLREFGETINKISADDCHLFMWTTQKFLPLALELADHYGFRYVLTMTWHKPGGYQPTGLPQFNCEFVIYARKGKPKFVTTQGFYCCFNGPRREHSRKPDGFYDMIKLVTKGPRIDVFSRERRDGFDQYGNEVDAFTDAAE